MRVSKFTLVLGLGGLVLTVEGTYQSSTCAALAAAFPGDVFYPNSTAYIQANDYWSVQQEDVHPHCFVAPRDTEGVSTAMKLLTSRNASFTVKSGGHTPFAGGSNIANGVTIDLVHLNGINISDDRQTVSLGPGNRWINVTEVLDPLNLAVVGGRSGAVGAAGLILGGGISYFSGERGWACDNVRNFEVVVASGEVVNASPEVNPDLYWALRGGGGSNFGIVTRFDLESFEQGDLWSNELTFPGALNATLLSLFQNLTINGMPSDPAAHSYLSIYYEASLGEYIVNTSFYHAGPPPPAASMPAVFEPFQSVPDAISNTTLVANISTHLGDVPIPYGFRQTWWNTAISATSLDLLTEIVSLFEARNAPLLAASNGSSTTPFLLFQALPLNILTQMQKNGGNALGLKPSDGPLLVVSIPTTWEDPRLDARIESSSRELIAQIERLAKQSNLDNGYVYMNYASSTQQVQKQYGEDNLRRLEEIARKWDPQGKLARLWPGYFKLDV
ncbi:hypothetical protein UA08_02265 [Talaromyces atroroseus]|uniref:FAD-binding PCMH-type domain-containing protein n=1 Tax=Talaromyces atroroseus TaxID=1441469 RepID=A0A225B676_TALAT|nr:hypothetical protein UA08_02265 [Talaromyces atroroseus]OKL62375.1 hypothetical protein UA08_02265 [Talaromyces atroroseus]